MCIANAHSFTGKTTIKRVQTKKKGVFKTCIYNKYDDTKKGETDKCVVYGVCRHEGGIFGCIKFEQLNTWGVYLCVNLSRIQALKGITLCCYNKIR